MTFQDSRFLLRFVNLFFESSVKLTSQLQPKYQTWNISLKVRNVTFQTRALPSLEPQTMLDASGLIADWNCTHQIGEKSGVRTETECKKSRVTGTILTFTKNDSIRHPEKDLKGPFSS